MSTNPYNPNSPLTEKLRLGVPKNDPWIRRINWIGFAVVIFCLLVGIASAAEPKQKPAEKLAAAEQQIAALQAENRYLLVLAERNEAAVRLLQADIRVQELQRQLEEANAKIAELEKKLVEPQPQNPEKKP